jgi:putative hydrolase of the HAD superfamily
MSKKNSDNIKGIIFDLGYTLIEYFNCDWAQVNLKAKQTAYNKLLSLNVQLPGFAQFDSQYEFLKEESRRSAFDAMRGWKITSVIEDIFKEYKLNDPEGLAQIFVESFYEPGRDVMHVYQESLDTLALLKSRGYKLGVISNTNFPGYLHESDLERFGLMPFFDFMIFSSEFGWRKPHRKIFEEGVHLMDFPPADIVYVGDRFKMDALGARDVGMQPIVKYCGKREYPDPMPDNILMICNINDITDLLPETAKLHTTL